MSLRKAILAVVVVLAMLAPASAQASNPYRTVVGVASGEGIVNTATLQVTARQTLWLSHIGRGTVEFQAQATRADGIVRAVGPFTIVTSDGDEITGTGSLVGVGPTLDVHPVGFIMTITGGTGRFAAARGTLVTAPLVTPRLPFSPPMLFEKLECAVHGFIDY